MNLFRITLFGEEGKGLEIPANSEDGFIPVDLWGAAGEGDVAAHTAGVITLPTAKEYLIRCSIEGGPYTPAQGSMSLGILLDGVLIRTLDTAYFEFDGYSSATIAGVEVIKATANQQLQMAVRAVLDQTSGGSALPSTTLSIIELP